jgi:tRNA1(Val) A37 N6-methylase TrmN6
MSMKIVKNDLFDYQNRYIYQFKDGFKFSLDSILLAEYVSILKKNVNILDMCTGNAPVPLIISLKTKSPVVGYEIQKDIADLAKKSVLLNNLEEQITIINDSIYNIGNIYKPEFFDIITCNPPYFKANMAKIYNKNDMLSIARHEIAITLEDIFKIAFKYLKNKGILYLVHRVERIDDIIYYAIKYRVLVKEIQLIATKSDDIPNTVIVKCIKNAKAGVKVKKVVNVGNISTYQHLFDRKDNI